MTDKDWFDALGVYEHLTAVKMLIHIVYHPNGIKAAPNAA